MSQQNGVLYIAVGESYVAEAQRSAASVKAMMPHLPVTLISNHPDPGSMFDTVVTITQNGYRSTDRARLLLLSPYVRTLFLDTDTHVCAPVDELFTLMDRFDLAAAHGQWRFNPDDARRLPHVVQQIPASFPQYNTGILVFKQSDALASFIEAWIAIDQRNIASTTELGGKPPSNQTGFREALYLSDLRLATLTPEYHCRPGFLGFLAEEVKILHGRRQDLTQAAPLLNSSREQRVYVNEAQRLRLITRSAVARGAVPGVGKRLVRAVRRHGLMGAARLALGSRGLLRFGNLPPGNLPPAPNDIEEVV